MSKTFINFYTKSINLLQNVLYLYQNTRQSGSKHEDNGDASHRLHLWNNTESVQQQPHRRRSAPANPRCVGVKKNKARTTPGIFHSNHQQRFKQSSFRLLRFFRQSAQDVAADRFHKSFSSSHMFRLHQFAHGIFMVANLHIASLS